MIPLCHPLYHPCPPPQVMERLFTLLSNLDTGPSHRGTDQQAKPELLVQSTHLGKVGLQLFVKWTCFSNASNDMSHAY